MSKKAKSKQAISKMTGKPRSNRGCKGIDEQALILKIYFEKPPAGMNNKQLAEWLGISEDSFYDFKKSNSDFFEAVNFYTGESHLEVLKSFKKIACGFTYDEITREPEKDANGKIKMVVTKKLKKYVTPSADAAFKYLKNKMPDHFKDRVENVHSFDGGVIDKIEFVIKPRANG